jgi:Baseplate J-like protein
MIYFCAQKNRRELVLAKKKLNGIDYLEVLGSPGCGTQLAVTFLNDATSLSLGTKQISITGGAPVHAASVTAATAQDPNVVIVGLDQTGDFSTYTFALVADATSTDPPAGIDPQLASIDFSFKAGCPAPTDCRPVTCCAPVLASPPDINYLAKDYNGFLRVMLDRLAVLMPGWAETHAADLGVTLTEALAYAADHLSYQQDAVSTEAYLGTARSRISLRRHARLVNYQIGEGCNARTLVSVTVSGALQLPARTLFYPRVPGLGPAVTADEPVAAQLGDTSQPAFMSTQVADLDPALNCVEFYTWEDGDCCLPAGATQATLQGTLDLLRRGSMLIFQEVKGPLTGAPEDADPTHRCAVQLTSVTTLTDQLTGTDVSQITWAAADALPFPLCISSTINPEQGPQPVSVALGNIVPADHGTGVPAEGLGTVPAAPLAPDPAAGGGCGPGTQAGAAASLSRYYPGLARSPLTFSVPDQDTTSAAASGSPGPAGATAFLSPGTAGAVPDIYLTDTGGFTWQPKPDLLSYDGTQRFFVPEIEYDGSVFLRFGDNQHGMAPEAGLDFTATYRIGNGSAGNVGRDALAHVVLPAHSPSTGIVTGVTNPLAATGGTDPEDMEHIRQFAPYAYQQQLRCVTEADYGVMAAQVNGVSAARGTLRWTGSWYTAFASIEPAVALTAQVIDDTTTRLDVRRMMGTAIAVEQAVIVGLQIEMEICVDPAHFQGDVFQSLMDVFITGNQRTGAPGLLNPASFTFGQTVYASPLVAAAQAVEGVRSATLTVFTPMDAPWVDGVTQGYLTMGRLDIPRCDNDPDHLDHGTFTLHMDGGK